jgi:hypothetical protein
MDQPNDRAKVEYELLLAQIAKLRRQTAILEEGNRPHLSKMIADLVPVITAIVAVVGVWLSIKQYNDGAKERQAEQGRIDRQRVQAQIDAQNLDARHALWDRQIDVYFQAAKAAATIATSTDPKAVNAAKEVFWNLYWGPLAVAEDKLLTRPQKELEDRVEFNMVTFGEMMRDSKKTKQDLQQQSLKLAHALAMSIESVFQSIEQEDKGKRKQASAAEPSNAAEGSTN